MRIGFITPEFVTESNFSGGLANYIHRSAKSLISFGHQVDVVTFSRDTGKLTFDFDGITVHRVSAGKKRRFWDRITRRRLPGTAHWLEFSFNAYRKAKSLHGRKPFDILQFSNYRACGLFAELLLPVPSVTRISSYRPLWNELTGMNRNLDVRTMELLEILHLYLSRNKYAPSHTLKKVLRERAGIRSVRVIRTPFYMETGDLDSSVYDRHLKGGKYALYFGRFQLLKGFRVLADALEEILGGNPGFHFAFVGKDMAGGDIPSLKEYALFKSGEYADRLIFLDELRHKQLYPIIRGADLVVLPSLADNLPNTCLEAMGMGKPVLGTVGASFDELITDGVNGFLAPVGDAKALAEKVNEALLHPDLEKIGEAAREKAADFLPEKTVEELLRYYRQVIGEH